jgi:hypothetical protein
MLTSHDVTRFHRDGYLIVAGVFSPEEIDRLRDTVDGVVEPLPSAGTPDNLWLLGDLAASPELSPLATDPRLVGIARDILGDRPIYFRDSAVSVVKTVKDQTRGWHKDNRVPDRYDPLTPDWEGDYPVIRMGIYCEDHVDHSGGLALRAGSHQRRSSPLRRLIWGAVHRLRPRAGVRAHAHGITSGKACHAATRPGDVVVWTLRTSHSGFSMRPRIGKNVKLPPKLETRLPDRFFRPAEDRRTSIFITYGAKSVHLDRLLEFLPTRDYFRERNLSRPVCAEALAAFAADADAVELREPALAPG